MSRKELDPTGLKVTKYTESQYQSAATLTIKGVDFIKDLKKILFSLQPDSVITGGFVVVDEPFKASTTLNIGDAVTAAKYGSAIDLATVGKTKLTVDLSIVTDNFDIYGEVAAATDETGSARVIIQYIGNEKADWTEE